MASVFRELRTRMVLMLVDDNGMSTVEYAIGTIAAAAALEQLRPWRHTYARCAARTL